MSVSAAAMWSGFGSWDDVEVFIHRPPHVGPLCGTEQRCVVHLGPALANPVAGPVLWSQSFTPSVVSSDVVNRVIRTTFLEERTATRKVDVGNYTIHWKFSNELELVFMVRC